MVLRATEVPILPGGDAVDYVESGQCILSVTLNRINGLTIKGEKEGKDYVIAKGWDDPFFAQLRNRVAASKEPQNEPQDFILISSDTSFTVELSAGELGGKELLTLSIRPRGQKTRARISIPRSKKSGEMPFKVPPDVTSNTVLTDSVEVGLIDGKWRWLNCVLDEYNRQPVANAKENEQVLATAAH